MGIFLLLASLGRCSFFTQVSQELTPHVVCSHRLSVGNRVPDRSSSRSHHLIRCYGNMSHNLRALTCWAQAWMLPVTSFVLSRCLSVCSFLPSSLKAIRSTRTEYETRKIAVDIGALDTVTSLLFSLVSIPGVFQWLLLYCLGAWLNAPSSSEVLQLYFQPEHNA